MLHQSKKVPKRGYNEQKSVITFKRYFEMINLTCWPGPPKKFCIRPERRNVFSPAKIILLKKSVELRIQRIITAKV